MEIIVLCGIPGSGKSTFYEKKLKDNFEIISLDFLGDRGKEIKAVNLCLAENKSFVIDNTNVSKDERERYVDIARKKHIQITCCFFQPNVKKAIERNIGRGSKGGRFVPEQVIFAMNKRFEMPSYDEGFNDIYMIEDDYDEYKAVRIKSISYIESMCESNCGLIGKDNKSKNDTKINKERDGYAYVLANRVDNRVFIGTRKDISSKEELLSDIIKRNTGSNQLSESIREIGKENLYIKHIESFSGIDDFGKKIIIGKLLKEFGGNAMAIYQERYIEFYEEDIKNTTVESKEPNDKILSDRYMIYILANRLNSKIYVGSRKRRIKESDLLHDILSKNSGQNALSLAIKDIGQDNFYIKNIKYISCSKDDLNVEIGKMLIENGAECLLDYQTQNIELAKSHTSM